MILHAVHLNSKQIKGKGQYIPPFCTSTDTISVSMPTLDVSLLMYGSGSGRVTVYFVKTSISTCVLLCSFVHTFSLLSRIKGGSQNRLAGQFCSLRTCLIRSMPFVEIAKIKTLQTDFHIAEYKSTCNFYQIC